MPAMPETSHAAADYPYVMTLPSNENKMSDGGRGRASLGVEGWKSSQKWDVQRSAVRSIAWLGCDQYIPNLSRMFPSTDFLLNQG